MYGEGHSSGCSLLGGPTLARVPAASASTPRAAANLGSTQKCRLSAAMSEAWRPTMPS